MELPLSRDLRIAVIDTNPLRAAILEDGLHASGHMNVVRIDDTADLLDRIRSIDPDVILIDLERPGRDVLDQMFTVSRSVARPVAMFVDKTDAAMTHAAIDAGVSAYTLPSSSRSLTQQSYRKTIARQSTAPKL